MKRFIFTIEGVAFFSLFVMWLVTRIDYRIGRSALKILLFGVPIRRISLANIKSVSKRSSRGWSENWSNTWKPSHRKLVVRRLSGFRKSLIITPPNRYIFTVELEQAVKRAKAALPAGSQSASERVEMEVDPSLKKEEGVNGPTAAHT